MQTHIHTLSIKFHALFLVRLHSKNQHLTQCGPHKQTVREIFRKWCIRLVWCRLTISLPFYEWWNMRFLFSEFLFYDFLIIYLRFFFLWWEKLKFNYYLSSKKLPLNSYEKFNKWNKVENETHMKISHLITSSHLNDFNNDTVLIFSVNSRDIHIKRWRCDDDDGRALQREEKTHKKGK